MQPLFQVLLFPEVASLLMREFRFTQSEAQNTGGRARHLFQLQHSPCLIFPLWNSVFPSVLGGDEDEILLFPGLPY